MLDTWRTITIPEWREGSDRQTAGIRLAHAWECACLLETVVEALTLWKQALSESPSRKPSRGLHFICGGKEAAKLHEVPEFMENCYSRFGKGKQISTKKNESGGGGGGIYGEEISLGKTKNVYFVPLEGAGFCLTYHLIKDFLHHPHKGLRKPQTFSIVFGQRTGVWCIQFFMVKSVLVPSN